MPYTSADIAAQIAQGQQAHMMHVHSPDIINETLRRSQDPQYGANQIAAKAFNGIGAVGVPLVGLGLGMAGLDPMSMGMKGFGAARGLGMGYMAAGGAALGAFGAASAVGAGVHWAANQMTTGAQQYQQFSQGMQQNYNFMTPQGSGFSNHQLGQIGGQLRQMSGQVGPLGQMTSFNELSQLAQQMGPMGLGGGQGSQDVSSFTQKFRQMLDTVKHITKEIGGSLKDAQQMMAGMRNSGVMQAADQRSMATEMRQLGLSGGLATPELTQMAGIGSRVSRAVGGLGSQGAFAGMRTLGNIGMALQSGGISENDIYNATGVHGAEGRQALAASQLQNAAGWLRGGRGRRFLASVANDDGKLDMDSVSAWMNGDMGVGNTMGRSGKNLAGVGRANFIRNEGRLRGSALEAFGGNLPAMALGQWASSKGIDIDNMDDRSMIFAQRQLGMGRDEVDMAVKMLKALPDMKSHARTQGAVDDYRKGIAAHNRTKGIEGGRRKLEETREHIQNALQSKGQQMYTEIVSEIDGYLQKLGGTLMQEASKDIDKAYSNMRKGGGGSQADLLFGTGTAFVGRAREMGTGPGTFTQATAEQFDAAGPLGLGTSLRDRMHKAGYKSDGSAGGIGGVGKDRDAFGLKASDDVEGSSHNIHAAFDRAKAYSEGAKDETDQEAIKMGERNRDLLVNAYASGGLAKIPGMDRHSALMRELEKIGTHESADLMDALSISKDPMRDATKEEAAAAGRRLSSLEVGMGQNADSRLSANSALPEGVSQAMGKGGMTETDTERKRRYGGGTNDTVAGRMLESITGVKRGQSVGLADAGRIALRTGANVALAALTGGGSLIAHAVGSTNEVANEAQVADRQGNFLTSREGLEMSRSIMSGVDVDKQLDKLATAKGTAKEDVSMYQNMKAASRLLRQEASGGKVDWDKHAGAKSMVGRMKAAYQEQTDINRQRAAQIFSGVARNEERDLRSVGILDSDGNISESMSKSLAGSGPGGAAAYAAHISLTKQEGTGKYDENSWQNIKDQGLAKREALLGMSTKDLRGLASTTRAAGDGGFADEASQMAAARSKVEKYSGRGNWGTAMALGVKLTGREAHDFQKLKGGALTKALANKLGIQELDAQGEADINKQIASVQADDKLGGYDKEKKVQELQDRITSGKRSNELGAKLKGLEGLEGEAKKAALLDLATSPAMKEEQKKNAEKAEQSDPSVRQLTAIAKSSEYTANAMKSLAADIAAKISDKMPKEAPKPPPG